MGTGELNAKICLGIYGRERLLWFLLRMFVLLLNMEVGTGPPMLFSELKTWFRLFLADLTLLSMCIVSSLLYVTFVMKLIEPLLRLKFSIDYRFDGKFDFFGTPIRYP